MQSREDTHNDEEQEVNSKKEKLRGQQIRAYSDVADEEVK